MSAAKLSPQQRMRLEQRRDEINAELRQIETLLRADTSARLSEKLKTPKQPTLERGRWSSGKWRPC